MSRILSSADHVLSVLQVHLGVFHDQDGVLGPQAHQHNHGYLHVHIVLLPSKILGSKAAQYSGRDGQDDRDRNGPALIQGGQHQEHEDQGNNVDTVRRRTGISFVPALVDPLRSIGGRQNFLCHLLQNGHALTGRITGRRRTGHLKGAGAVKAGYRRHRQVKITGDQGIQRNHVAVAALYEEQIHVAHITAEGLICLHNYLPGTAEGVEIIDLAAAQESLQGSVNAGNRYVQGLCLFPVHGKLISGSISTKGSINRT